MKYCAIIVGVVAAFCFISLNTFSQADAQNNKQENFTSVDVSKEQLKDQKLSFKFVVKIPKDLIFNDEGPWKLKLKAHEGLSFEKDEFSIKDVKKDLPGFAVVTKEKPAKPKGAMEYTLTSFVCAKDKSKCYREVHNGTMNW